VTGRIVAYLPSGAVVADLGSGAGELLASIYDRVRVTGIGIDLSTAASEQAARRYPHLTWVVANADRRLPLLDRSVDVVVSLHGRRNPAECARVITATGHLAVVFPAADDLQELRALLHGEATDRERAETVIAEHRESFELVDRAILREHRPVDADGLRDLLRGTYRGARASEASRLTTLGTLAVTIASEMLVFALRVRD
jgi:23S rRNA (guanine745-N1)-methyltransferase